MDIPVLNKACQYMHKDAFHSLLQDSNSEIYEHSSVCTTFGSNFILRIEGNFNESNF